MKQNIISFNKTSASIQRDDVFYYCYKVFVLETNEQTNERMQKGSYK